MLPTKLEQGLGAALRGCGIAAKYIVVDLEVLNNGERRSMSAFDRACDCPFDQRARLHEFTELPLGMGEVGCRDGGGIAAEAKLRLMIPLGVVYP